MINESVKVQEGYEYIIQGDYQQAASYYEQAIEAEPEVRVNYWFLGLCLLLQGQEEEASLTWFLAMGETDDDQQIDQWTLELSQVLESEAERQEELDDKLLAWTIRQYLRTINPTDVNNLLSSFDLALQLKILDNAYWDELNIIEILESTSDYNQIDSNLVLKVTEHILDLTPLAGYTLKFIKIFTNIIKHQGQNIREFRYIVISGVIKIMSFFKRNRYAAQILEILLLIGPEHPDTLLQLSTAYQDSRQYAEGINAAKKLLLCSETLTEKVYTHLTLIRALMTSTGYWDEACAAINKQAELIAALIQESPIIKNNALVSRLFFSMFFFPYFQDEPATIRPLQNDLMSLCLKSIEIYDQDIIREYRYSLPSNKSKNKVLKIGYISSFLKEHSVGWITRWLFTYHNRENFQIYSYMMLPAENHNGLQEWFIEKSDKSYSFGAKQNHEAIKQIHEDGIDILVDLDSLTFDLSVEILAIKPAPIQVTWLGWDASGLSTIDYFIADPYVLPENAQDYYQEKIWRLPQTYVAVDGFEVNVPTLRREQLDIPDDAVVYFVTQSGYKRHIEHSKLQIEIIKQVPNSYLLIKGQADEEASQKFYGDLAKSQDVDINRLKFVPLMPTEAIHRANLSLADVVLDTSPYNGATTTLETLWREIPLVTKVGQQFAARNSYTMMINAGITEGIAWSDEEYVEWGVRLGKDAELREQISWKLKQGKKSAPLWNGKQFTREMEKAYQQMWEIYVAKNCI
ncbi:MULTISPECIES: O-linked N-acetylglucosamine transferase, SPINDLY family protein [unclassified Nodularia (in: cyanobacteria)]|uniref:O-linked N-acetylglucosamine transferase, SPINDLY family protein n=1 Tax=unclassified Nodularia (in: cyanobacteria) TaxID=2656917 RepID=UPI00187E508B|nr:MULTISPECIES: O-linked N-acetylglucosamine transferase, SPINDLY family protein [unclassified Nodularia (in: cyanobacteria)]MBE9202127.1 O-linked N-acetylglucosamine transferase, SPINDLY family protein [Nodularia sp. LEGE 06071]MCC2694858.1 O-linked N-acetylglucosamine transferase, SPINDLY family protein [Nodularia sp. LEGE 04288]